MFQSLIRFGSASAATLFLATVANAGTIQVEFTGQLIAGSGGASSTVLGAPDTGGLAIGDTITAVWNVDTATVGEAVSSGTRYITDDASANVDGNALNGWPLADNILFGDGIMPGGGDFLSLKQFYITSGYYIGTLDPQALSLTLIDNSGTAISDEALTADNINGFSTIDTASLSIKNPDFGTGAGYLPSSQYLFAFFETVSFSATLLDDGGPDPSPVPLPAGFPLLAVGLGCFAALRRQRR